MFEGYHTKSNLYSALYQTGSLQRYLYNNNICKMRHLQYVVQEYMWMIYSTVWTPNNKGRYSCPAAERGAHRGGDGVSGFSTSTTWLLSCFQYCFVLRNRVSICTWVTVVENTAMYNIYRYIYYTFTLRCTP